MTNSIEKDKQVQVSGITNYSKAFDSLRLVIVIAYLTFAKETYYNINCDIIHRTFIPLYIELSLVLAWGIN